ncbi:MAG: apolipoprotein N-acyltransferase [Simkaniaceae bacterium]|nr:apolipoprotein N-acyltransferase [Simkaniaceae bacterium]
MHICSIVISFFLVAFGQPAWSSLLSVITAFCGYALFWKGLLSFESKKRRFFLAFCWFFGVQAIQFSWFANLEYHGIYILFVYFVILIWLGVQFGLLNLLFPLNKELSFVRIGAIASFWVLLEWSRLFVFCGFSWNQVGLALSANDWSSQLASIGGVFFLSFWVMVVNLLAVRATYCYKTPRACLIGVGCGLMPYLFGVIQIYIERSKQEVVSLDIALVQTGVRPDQKTLINGRVEEFISPFEQWHDVFQSIISTEIPSFDLIVLPEVAVSFSAYLAIYPYKTASLLIEKDLGISEEALRKYLVEPYATQRMIHAKKEWVVTNAFFTRILADHFSAEVVVGFDHQEKETGRNYNAAFHFTPQHSVIESYGKRALLPLAEYLPYEFLRPLVSKYGITDFFSRGKVAKVFQGKVPFAISICYDECFGHFVREGRREGGKLLVNVTNDDWFPDSRLARQHFNQGRLRSIENGVPSLRACNTGGTAVIDGFGRVVDQFQDQYGQIKWQKGVLQTRVNVHSHITLYSILGNYFVLGLSFFLLGLFVLGKQKK